MAWERIENTHLPVMFDDRGPGRALLFRLGCLCSLLRSSLRAAILLRGPPLLSPWLLLLPTLLPLLRAGGSFTWHQDNCGLDAGQIRGACRGAGCWWRVLVVLVVCAVVGWALGA